MQQYENILNEFKQHLVENDRSQLTIKNYCGDLKQFLEWIPSLDAIGKMVMIDYSKHLENIVVRRDKKKKRDEYMAPSSIKRKLVALEQFIGFLNEKKGYDIVYTKKKINTSLQAVDDYISNKDIKRMVTACDKDIKEGKKKLELTKNARVINGTNKEITDAYRAKTLILAMFYTGTRVNTLRDIDLCDIMDRNISVKGKGQIYYDLYFPKKLKKAFIEYSKYRNKTSNKLFTTSYGTASVSTMQRDVKKYAKIVRGIDLKHAHPHSLRHLYAQNLEKMYVNGNKAIRDTMISQLIGHTLNINQRYGMATKKELYEAVKEMDLDKLVKK